MATFSVNDQVRRDVTVGDGSTVSFPFSFQVNATTDVKVYVDDTLKVAGTHYDIVDSTDSAGLNSDGTGKVKFKTTPTDYTPANNALVTVVSEVPVARTSVYTAGGNITAASLESDFDTITMQVGDREQEIARAIRGPLSDPTSTSMVLPNKTTRANKFMAFDGSGNVSVTAGTTTVPISSAMEPVFSASTLAVGRDALLTGTTLKTILDASGQPGQAPVLDGSGGVIFANASGSKRLNINGAMNIAQRGNSLATRAETGITADTEVRRGPDRYKFGIFAGGTWTVRQHENNSATNITPLVTGDDYFRFSYRADCTTARASLHASSSVRIVHQIEGQDLLFLGYGTSNAQPVTLSFYVSAGITGTYIVNLTRDNSAGGTSSRSVSKSYTVSSTNTWQKVTLTFPADTGGNAFDPNDNEFSFTISWYLAAGTTFTSGSLATTWEATTNANIAVGQVNGAGSTAQNFYLTGVQLEAGSSASPFEHRTQARELQDCQRYFQRSGNLFHTDDWYISTDPEGAIMCQALGSDTDKAPVRVDFPVTMRKEPTLKIFPASTSGTTLNTITHYNDLAQNTAFGSSSTDKPHAYANGITGIFGGIASEAAAYQFHYTVEAES